MGFFSKIFKGLKKVIKKTIKVVKKVVKSKAFKVLAAVALAVAMPGLGATLQGFMSSAGAAAASTFNTILGGVKAVGVGVKALVTGQGLAAGTAPLKAWASSTYSSLSKTIISGVDYVGSKLGIGTLSAESTVASYDSLAITGGKVVGYAAPSTVSNAAAFAPTAPSLKDRVGTWINDKATEKADEIIDTSMAGMTQSLIRKAAGADDLAPIPQQPTPKATDDPSSFVSIYRGPPTNVSFNPVENYTNFVSQNPYFPNYDDAAYNESMSSNAGAPPQKKTWAFTENSIDREGVRISTNSSLLSPTT
jgi:hypothetical protein